MIVRSWARTTRVRSRNLALSMVLACSASGQPLATLGQTYRKAPTDANRAALTRFAASHMKSVEGAQALLVTAAADVDRKSYDDALADLKTLDRRLPTLGDYVAYLRASVQFESKNYSETVRELHTVLKHAPPSPLSAKATILLAHAEIEIQKPKEALELIRKNYASLTAPQGDFLLAKSSEAMGDMVAAASYYQNVYYLYPSTPEAAQAQTALESLKQSLGDKLPPPMPQTVLIRTSRLMNSGEAKKAKAELEALVPQLGGTERDLAKVRIGVAAYFLKDNEAAYQYLRTLTVASPEPDAERLYYLQAAAQRLKSDGGAADALDHLNKQYPASQWRLQALLAAANRSLVTNQSSVYEPLYRACYESFPDSAEAPGCHWKVAWNQYLKRGPDAARMMREHLTRYPSSEKAAAALYFLGRAAEKQKMPAEARDYYAQIAERYPNFFHAVLARERLALPSIAHAGASPETDAFLESVKFRANSPKRTFEPDAPTKDRIDRARLLAAAGLEDWADSELRFAARTDGQPHVLALELAQMAEARGAHDQGIRYIKSLAGGYLSIPFNAAPDKFWKLAFPMPYRSSLEANSKLRDLDPYMVAALIRQESEFNPLALSRANAYGLTQVMPATGRELSRKLGVARFTAKMLFDPDLNLKLGTYYLRQMLNRLDGKWETTLAAYNAGKSRVDNWLTYAAFEEPAEFIESIPFTETRDYVQIVIRNADVYRRLYGSKQTAVLSTNGH